MAEMGGSEGLVRRRLDICLLRIPLAVGVLASCGGSEALLSSVSPALHERPPWPHRAHWAPRPRGECRGCTEEGDTSVERGTYSNHITPSLLPRVSLDIRV